MRSFVLVGTLSCVLATVGLEAQAPQVETCPVTVAGERRQAEVGLNYGNEFLHTSLWQGGTVIFKPGGPGFILRDGALSMKFGWWRHVPGRLIVEGRRLGGPAAVPFRSRIPDGYGDIGFQSTALVFPSPGCWEVTARIGDASLTFVTLVVKIGEGPASRGDW